MFYRRGKTICVCKANFDLMQFEQFLTETNNFRKEKKTIPIIINWKILGTHSDLSLEMARRKSTRRKIQREHLLVFLREAKFKYHSRELCFSKRAKLAEVLLEKSLYHRI